MRAESLSDAAHQVWLLEINKTVGGQGWQGEQVLLRREDGNCHEYHLRHSCTDLGDGLWYIHDHATCGYIKARREVYTTTNYDPEVSERTDFPVRYRIPITREFKPELWGH